MTETMMPAGLKIFIGVMFALVILCIVVNMIDARNFRRAFQNLGKRRKRVRGKP
jgi:hypothetical protein